MNDWKLLCPECESEDVGKESSGHNPAECNVFVCYACGFTEILDRGY